MAQNHYTCIRCGEVLRSLISYGSSQRSSRSVQSFTHHINCSLDYIIQKLSIVGTWRPFRCGKMPLINSCMILFMAKIKHFPFRFHVFSLFISFFGLIWLGWFGLVRFGSLFSPLPSACQKQIYQTDLQFMCTICVQNPLGHCVYSSTGAVAQRAIEREGEKELTIRMH